MTFVADSYLITVHGGKKYLPVAARLIWFREDHPDWGIETKPVEINHEKCYAVFHTKITDSDGKLIASATKFENKQGFGDFIEKAETGSIGRALAIAGYGTQFALDEFDEGDRLADAPQSTTNGYSCKCGKAMTKSQAQYSMQHFKELLCLDCQNKRKQGQQGQGASSDVKPDAPPAEAEKPAAEANTCETCGAAMNKGQVTLSLTKHDGHLYCPKCSKGGENKPKQDPKQSSRMTRLCILSGEVFASDEELRTWLMDTFRVKSRKELSMAQVERGIELLTAMRAGK